MMTKEKKDPKGMALMIGVGMKPKKDDMPSAAPDDEEMPSSEEPMEGSPEDMKEDKNWQIDVPEGFEPPDDVQGMDQFDITCRAHMEKDENGTPKLCIDSVNGIKTEEGKEDNEGDEADESTAPPEQKSPQTLDDAMKAHSSSRPMGM